MRKHHDVDKSCLKWGEEFPDLIIATATFDRLVNSHIINVRGDTQRVMQKGVGSDPPSIRPAREIDELVGPGRSILDRD